MKTLKTRIERTFSLTKDLFEHLSNENLMLKLDNLPSNKIGEQVWCMIGARESYLKAIENEKWSGFSCSLNSVDKKANVLESLESSSTKLISFVSATTLTPTQQDLLFDLLEHELTHHGQLMRFVYGNKLGFPKSWNDRYTV